MVWRLGFAVVIALSGCRSAEPESASPPKAETPPAAVAAPAPEPAPEEVAAVPVAVAGAYLAQCSAETEATYVDDADLAQNLTACRLTDAAGNVVEATIDAVKVTVGDETLTPELVPKTKLDAIWSIAFKIDAEKALDASAIELAFTTKAAARATATATDANFDWRHHPAFVDVVVAGRKLLAIFRPDLSGFDGQGGIAACEGLADAKCHVAFFSSSLHTGDVTAAGADAICGELGAKLPWKREWLAYLSTTKTGALARFPAGGGIYSVDGANVGTFEPNKPPLFGQVRYDELGRTAYSPLIEPTTPAMEIFWTGSTGLGALDEAVGNCSDWTSAAATANGTITVSLAVEGHARRCSQVAHLLCIGVD